MQNFTFIAALRPKIAFIVDLRRQNIIELFMYKALFEASTDRADFLSRLFARQMQEKNLIVPVVGDFTDPKSMRLGST